MTQPWTFAGDPPSDRRSSGAAVTLIDGTTFTISEDTGDIEGGTHGLFVRDTRMLSRWQLGINGNPVSALTVQRSSPHSAAFLARTRPQAGQADSPVFVVRRRYVGSGQREDISLHNSSPHAFSCLLTLLIDSDFADLFEVKDGRALASGVNPAPRPQVNGHGTVRLARQRGSRTFATVVSADQGAEATDFGLQWRAVVPARGTWSTTIEAVAELDGATLALRHPRGDDMAVAAPMRDP